MRTDWTGSYDLHTWLSMGPTCYHKTNKQTLRADVHQSRRILASLVTQLFGVIVRHRMAWWTSILIGIL